MFTLFVISCAVISINETYWGSYTPLMKNTAECCSTDDGYKFKKFIGQSEKTNNDPNKSKYLRNVIAFYKDETNHVVRIIYSKWPACVYYMQKRKGKLTMRCISSSSQNVQQNDSVNII